MTATQAPTPGPLDSESAKLLVKGDLLLCADRIIRSVEQVDAERGVLWFTDGEACGPSVCAFIGRPDESGWMPWSGGENPVPGQRVEVRFEGGIVSEVLDSECFGWDRHKDPVVAPLYNIIAFRLAPTAPVEDVSTKPPETNMSPEHVKETTENEHVAAPVEASGSEREKLAATIKRHLLGVAPDDQDVVLEDDDWQLILAALLSARPLALGGQHSGGVPVDLVRRLLAAWPDDHVIGAPLAVEVANALSTTPARAEAQVDGAEMTRLLKLADSALANVTAFEDDARYIMGNTNYAITENARSEIRSFLLAQSAKTSVRPKALEILERLLDHSGARGSFDAMKHGDAVKDAEELLRSARSPGHTDLMVTPESIDTYMEAQDEGAAGERGKSRGQVAYEGWAQGLPGCEWANQTRTQQCAWEKAAQAVIDAHPSPTPAADADRVRIAVELINAEINAPLTGPTHGAWDRGRIAGLKEALAALKSTAAKEGGEV